MSKLPGVYSIFNKLFEHYQTIWIASDTHFDDSDLPNHPSGEELVKMINKQAGKKDLLLLLGDIGEAKYLKEIKADVILLLGNHDKGASNYTRQVWKEKFDQAEYQEHEALDEMKRLHPDCCYDIDEGMSFHTPFTYWNVSADNRLADLVFEGPLTLGEKIILSHEPIPNLFWALNIHGHDHSGPVNSDLYHYNVALSANNYQLTNFNQLLKSGPTAHIESLHRDTIDTAAQRAKKRGYSLKNKKGE